MQIQAPLNLSKYIKHYLFLQSNNINENRYRLFSNGNCGLVFTLNNNYILVNNVIIPHAALFGQFDSFVDLEFSKGTKALVIVFQPYGLYYFSKIPTSEVKNSIVEAKDVLGKHLIELHEIIASSKSILNIINLLNKHFLELLPPPKEKILIDQIVYDIIHSKGEYTIGDIINNYAIHEKKLQRLFSQTIGLSPKKFLKIARLHYFIDLLKNTENLTANAYLAGFYDQSHLVKDFKALTGITPKEYLRSSKLAVNLIEL
ncbi:helix-turn-helix domain-containing protein [Chondrinema litorale]|uniref:helix-turn-helix domain-containing protein n=1 Tax=Chondrinema litorale TaxID=2994555 RepID=UPI0025436C91|nr:helix-turn-helix domain-containing protein [Chondrinema litorale]UZR98441.1 helix-turn-helix domain-containing protein [Chondrinema litorale]